MKGLFFISIAALSLIFSGCADHIVEFTPSILDDQPQNVVNARYSSIQTNVFSNSCALSGCHAGAVPPNLSAASAYAAIVNRPSAQGGEYIVPGDPVNSYLYQKVLGSNISGQRMPRGAVPLSAAILDSIRIWIGNGALNN
ncbi:MAG: hypothetical protein ACRBF0_16020 [Calditrichia bacterium]